MKYKIYNFVFLSLLLITILTCQSSIIIYSKNQRNDRVNRNNQTNNILNNRVQTNVASTIQIAYQYQLTERGKVLIVPENILFEQNSSRVNADRYGRTIIYVSSLLGLTNIINIIVEGHTDNSGRETTSSQSYNSDRNNDILYLYENRGNESDLSYLRATAVSSYLTNAMRNKLMNIGVQNLINPYDDDVLNRRVEFIIIENSNDINIYNNYFRNNWFSKIGLLHS